MNDMAGIIAILCVFGIPLSAIWTSHRRKMLELQMQMRGPGSSGDLRAEVEALRQEVRSLRDTSTQYDLSFDTALQRMEQRVTGIERKTLSAQPDESLRTVGRL